MMTQDGGFCFKKERKKKFKKQSNKPQPKPFCALSSDIVEFLCPLCLPPLLPPAWAAQGEQNPSGSSCPLCSQMPSDQPGRSPSRREGGRADRQRWNSQVHLGVEGQDGNWSWEKSARKGQESWGLTFPHS